MQYMETTTNDLKPGYSTFALKEVGDRVDFYAYTGGTAINADEQGMKLNAHLRGYFLRKGFSDAILGADPNVLTPVYRDNENKSVSPSSVDEALKLIYDGKLNITGFKFNKAATQEQKEQAFGKLINTFVETSKNQDFNGDKNLFFVLGNFSRVIYSNGGASNMQISGPDVQEKLGLKTKDATGARMRTMLLESLAKRSY